MTKAGAKFEPAVNTRAGRITVALHPLSDDFERNNYIAFLSEYLARIGIDFREFRPHMTILSPPDVVHFHWPEHRLAAGAKNRLRAVATLVAIRAVRMRGTVLVYTAHNLAAHEGGSCAFDRWFTRTFDSMVDELIVLTRAGSESLLEHRPGLRRADLHHIRHGHLQRMVGALPSREDARARLGIQSDKPLVVFVGRTRPYKGVPELLAACKDLDVNVLVAGECLDADLRKVLEGLAAEQENVQLRIEFLSTEEMSWMVRAADIVALPYRQVFNSGSVLLALSAGRAVLVPGTPTFNELAEEVGQDWVHTFESGHLRSADIERALNSPEPICGPDFSSYTWEQVAQETTVAYGRARRISRAERTGQPVVLERGLIGQARLWASSVRQARRNVKLPELRWSDRLRVRIRSIQPLRDPVFIVGAPRSGTTFLGSLLAKLDGVTYFYEPPLFKYYVRLLDSHRASPVHTRAVYRLGLHVFLLAAPGRGPRVIEKNPSHVFVVEQLSRVFPDARFIVITRDGRDVACSLAEQPWHREDSLRTGAREPGGYLHGPFPHFYIEAHRRAEYEETTDLHRCIWIWRRYEEAARRLVETIEPRQIHQVRYEELMNTPEPTLASLLDFLDTPGAERDPVLKEACKAHTRSIGRWRTELAPSDHDNIEREAGDLLRDLGYH